MKKGKVYLIGAGCGSADLITVRGLEALKKCSAVVYDSLIDDALLKECPAAEKICVGKRSGRHSEKQENINSLLVSLAEKGYITARLKGGDPFVFGRGGEEIQELEAHNIPYEVIPGISSCIAVPELAGIPVTHRRVSRSFHVITGHTADGTLPDMSPYGKDSGTLVFLMGLSNLPQIARQLISAGKSPDTPAAVISDGASPRQRIVRDVLGNIAEAANAAGMSSPALIVIGETAALDFYYKENKPLTGRAIAVTGTSSFAEKLAAGLAAEGAEVTIPFGTEICAMNTDKALNALKNISSYTHLVLTSSNGVDILMQLTEKSGKDVRIFGNIKFAAIGRGTADTLYKRLGIHADIVPESYTAEALGKILAEKCTGGRVLILRAEKGSPMLTMPLAEKNIPYDDIKTYRLKCSAERSSLYIDADAVIFGSASGADLFFGQGGKLSENTKIIAIGNNTSCALEKYGRTADAVAEVHDCGGIIRAAEELL